MNDTLITGIGVVSPLGVTVDEVSGNMVNGVSGISKVTHFDVSGHVSQIAAMMPPMVCPAGWDAADFADRTKLEQASIRVMVDALRDGGLWDERHSLRVGFILATATEWMWTWEDDAIYRAVTPYCLHENDRPPITRTIADKLGIEGPVATISTACASGNYALALGRRWLDLGLCDVCLAGAAEIGVSQMTLGSFGNLRALSRRNDDPTRASRPFDRDRDGFVLGEGAAAFVLERAAEAKKRGAKVYGQFLGCGMTGDAHHPVIPDGGGTYAGEAIRLGLKDAKINPEQVGYINAHGTATPIGDVAETKAIRTVFGEYASRVPVSSTKSMTGHMLTAASAVEVIACLATFSHGAIPPTLNLDNVDPECQLCHVAHEAREAKVDIVVSNSFGFGGTNSSAVFKRI